MKTSREWAGLLLIVAAISFWLSWLLMPDQETENTQHILAIIKQFRAYIYYSVIFQIFSSILYIPALFLISQFIYPLQKTTFIGVNLLAIGAMGVCMDAFFHLLTFFMTHNTIQIRTDILTLMNFMQTQGIFFLIPILLPFFTGSLVLSMGLSKQKAISRFPQFTFIFAFALSIIGAILINKFPGIGGSNLALSVLGLFAIGQMMIGLDLMKNKNGTKPEEVKLE